MKQTIIITLGLLLTGLSSCINKEDLKTAARMAILEAKEEAKEAMYDDDDYGFRDSEKWGNVVSETCLLTDFNRIDVEGKVNVVFQQADSFKVVLHGNENVIHDYYELSANDGTLKVAQTKDMRGRVPKIRMSVWAPTLSHIKLQGTGDFDIIDPATFESPFTIISDGTGDTEINHLRCSGITIENNGTGDVKIRHAKCSGKITISAGGTGDVKGQYKATDIEVVSAGTGDIDIEVDCENLTANASGTGEVELEGKAKTFVRETNGLSKIDSKKLEAEEIIR